jgi:hypothetical protein
MTDDYLKQLEELRLNLMSTLKTVNSRIFREKRDRGENIPAQASPADDSPVPLHSEVEHSDKGKPASTRSTRRRRGT